MLVRIAVFALFYVMCLASQPSYGSPKQAPNPDVLFAKVYERLGVKLPQMVVFQPPVWRALDELRREPCDQRSIDSLAAELGKFGYRREAANSLINFVRACGAPVQALHHAAAILMSLTDHAKALEVIDEIVRLAPTSYDSYLIRAAALHKSGDYQRALIDYANVIELLGNKRSVPPAIYMGMADAYAKLGRLCEAITPILTWMSVDPENQDNTLGQKLISDYEKRGNCPAPPEVKPEKYAMHSQQRVVTVNAAINGVRGKFIIDTGASYVLVKSQFADRAKIAYSDASEIKLSTANGFSKGLLTRAEKVQLGKLEALNVPTIVQKGDEKSLAGDIDGLLGMSFLTRFDLQMSKGVIELRTRHRK